MQPWDSLIQTPNSQVTAFPVLKSAAGFLNKLVHDDKIKPSFTVSHNPAKRLVGFIKQTE